MIDDPWYPNQPAYQADVVNAEGGHRLHVEQWGTPGGKPALLLHGGPGSGSSPFLRRSFDPNRYRVISFDQRGSGRSEPRGETRANTTQHLIDDIVMLRKALGVGPSLVVGGSWGATLALAYAAAHAADVEALLLRALFLARTEDVAWFFQGGVAVEPAAWSMFADAIEQATGVSAHGQLAPLLGALDAALQHSASATREAVALAWWRWEAALSGGASASIRPDAAALAERIDRYRVQVHYLRHSCWLAEPPLLDRCEVLNDRPTLPMKLLHGDVDRICPAAEAYALKQRLPGLDLQWVAGAGHDPTFPAMAAAMRSALDAYADHGDFGANFRSEAGR